MKKVFAKGLALAFLGSMVMAGNAMALTIDHGTMLTMIDGNADQDVTADLMFSGFTAGYEFGYYLGSDNVFNSLGPINFVNFVGGTVVDFAFRNIVSNNIYRASEDLMNDDFSVNMSFFYPISGDQAQQPELADASVYYGGVQMAWIFSNQPGAVFGVQAEMNSNDGVAPVPEPATMLLFGTGLAGLAGYGRKKIRKN
ncbi:MAG: PEP-CTERM sorting domain-containing protein [Pseudomonadota bacterium]